jgi:hypothetical protein
MTRRGIYDKKFFQKVNSGGIIKDYTANAFVCEKIEALYLMLNKH